MKISHKVYVNFTKKSSLIRGLVVVSIWQEKENKKVERMACCGELCIWKNYTNSERGIKPEPNSIQ